MRSSIVNRATIAALLGMALTLSARAAGAAESTPIPTTSAEIWQAIDSHVQELHAAVAKGKLANVHVDAFAIRDLTRGLSTHSQGLPETSLAKVKEQSRFIDTLAARLDQTGDANDKSGTEANLTKLEGLLKTIRVEYASSK